MVGIVVEAMMPGKSTKAINNRCRALFECFWNILYFNIIIITDAKQDERQMAMGYLYWITCSVFMGLQAALCHYVAQEASHVPEDAQDSRMNAHI